MFTEREIAIANATCRTNGASAFDRNGNVRAIVPKYILEHAPKNISILDYGAGKGAVHTLMLRQHGFTNVTAYEFGNNAIENLHDKLALDKKYDLVYASNVLNVQSSYEMLVETLSEICMCVNKGGAFIANYPAAPRKLFITPDVLANVISGMFDKPVELIGGTKSAPMWRVVK